MNPAPTSKGVCEWLRLHLIVNKNVSEAELTRNWFLDPDPKSPVLITWVLVDGILVRESGVTSKYSPRERESALHEGVFLLWAASCVCCHDVCTVCVQWARKV